VTAPRLTDADLVALAERLGQIRATMYRTADYGPVVPPVVCDWAEALRAIELALRAYRV
jgi:hypothetical protein